MKTERWVRPAAVWGRAFLLEQTARAKCPRCELTWQRVESSCRKRTGRENGGRWGHSSCNRVGGSSGCAGPRRLFWEPCIQHTWGRCKGPKHSRYLMWHILEKSLLLVWRMSEGGKLARRILQKCRWKM